ncbi:MAG: ATP-binding protein [Nocardioides sp.]
MRSRPLIGRDEPVALLEATLARVAADEPAAVVIEGEAGIGKTALLRHLMDAANRRGMRVLTGTSLPGSGRDVPFLAWRGVAWRGARTGRGVRPGPREQSCLSRASARGGHREAAGSGERARHTRGAGGRALGR